ncbi:hypothetical protein CIPAW_14G126700 [Carya illinoinensis]|uniref:Uncharacterized protein n=1 Tax=Carya illinoinensis TaxID=32201 RepID=A0A8T1NML8_CARIL|nr:hypothetical protein CIPAW_14G126700 [Carya illinoinensis]
MTLDINIVYRRWDSFVTQIHSIFHEMNKLSYAARRVET